METTRFCIAGGGDEQVLFEMLCEGAQDGVKLLFYLPKHFYGGGLLPDRGELEDRAVARWGCPGTHSKALEELVESLRIGTVLKD